MRFPFVTTVCVPMKRPATLHRYRPVALLMLVLHLTGCYSWRTTTASPAQLIVDEQPSTVRVTLTDGTQRTLPDPTVRNDSISGVALSDVRAVEVRSFSTGKTLGLIVGVPLGLAAVGVVYLLIVCANNGCT